MKPSQNQPQPMQLYLASAPATPNQPTHSTQEIAELGELENATKLEDWWDEWAIVQTDSPQNLTLDSVATEFGGLVVSHKPQTFFTAEEAIKFREYEESLNARIKAEDEARRVREMELEARLQQEQADHDAEVAQRRLEHVRQEAELENQKAMAWTKASRVYGPMVCAVLALFAFAFAAGAAFIYQEGALERAKILRMEKERLAAAEEGALERAKILRMEKERLAAAEEGALERAKILRMEKERLAADEVAEAQRVQKVEQQSRECLGSPAIGIWVGWR